MKPYFYLALFLPVSVLAQDRNIVLDEGIFGVPWASSEAELVEILGDPNGHFRISRFRKLVYFGKSHSFLFVNDQLKGYYLLEHNHTNLFNTPVSINQDFDQVTVSVEGREIIGKLFEEVETLIGRELGEPDYRANFATDFVSVRFTFSGSMGSGETSFRLSGIEIAYEL